MISFLGDIAFNGLISSNPELNSDRYEFPASILSKSEMVFANLEVPIKVDDSKNEHKNFIHYSLLDPTEDMLKRLNIGCVSLANNHIYDCKMSGLKATIDLLDKIGIKHTGAGYLKEHVEPVVLNIGSKKIAFLAYVDRSTNPKTESFSELFINYLDEDLIVNEIKKLRSNVDCVILSLHWGNDYSFYPAKRQIDCAHKFVEAGANIIMGHHPHTLQPFEPYKNGTIFYSLGGLTFGDFLKNGKIIALYRKTKKGLIAKLDSDKNTFQFIPTFEKKGNYVVKGKMNFKKWTKKRWKSYRLALHYKIYKKYLILKEKYADRVYEYFFGYYQNPVKRLFQLSNIKKIKKLTR